MRNVCANPRDDVRDHQIEEVDWSGNAHDVPINLAITDDIVQQLLLGGSYL